jgi:hypothetical protein
MINGFVRYLKRRGAESSLDLNSRVSESETGVIKEIKDIKSMNTLRIG